VAIDEIVLRALRPDVSERYQRAEDLLNDILTARRGMMGRPPAASPPEARPAAPTPGRRAPSSRSGTREVGASRFCWNCRKPLPAKAARCPFCGEGQ
jgi:hypothetical protein